MLELLPNVGKAAVAWKPRKRVKKTLQCPSDTSRPGGSSCWQQTRHTLGVQRVLWGRHRGLGVVGTTPEPSWQGRSPVSWHSTAQHSTACCGVQQCSSAPFWLPDCSKWANWAVFSSEQNPDGAAWGRLCPAPTGDAAR